MHLTLVDLHAVVAPSVVAELDDALLGLYGHFNHLVRTVDIAFQAVERLGIVEADTAVLALSGFHVGDVEGGMAANLEMDLAGVGVVHMPDDADLIAVEGIAHTEGEVVRIDFPGLFGRLEGEGHLTVAFANQLEVGIAGKTMTGQVVLLTFGLIGVVVDAAHDGEEDGGTAWPECGIALPEIFFTVCILDALELSSFLRYGDGDLFVS